MRIAKSHFPGLVRIIRIAILAALHIEAAKSVLVEPVFHGGSNRIAQVQHEHAVTLGDVDRVILFAHLAVLDQQIIVNLELRVRRVGIHKFDLAILNNAAVARSEHSPAPEVSPANRGRAHRRCGRWIRPHLRFVEGAVMPAEEDAAMVRVVVGRNAGDALARGRVHRMKAGRAGGRQANVVRLLGQIFKDDAPIRRLELHAEFNGRERVHPCVGNAIGEHDLAKRDGQRMASEKDKGTTVTVRLPLTLAIVEGLLVALGADNFVLPLSIVEECVELTRDNAEKSHGRKIANIRGEIVPYIRLRDEFNIDGESPPTEQIVVVRLNSQRIGLVVDKVVGEHQTVIKNLGRLYKDVEAVSGATILGDGTVALIVDAAKVLKHVEKEEAIQNNIQGGRAT